MLIKDFIDTSVFVAAFWGDHTDHESSLDARARKSSAACAAHSLAEVYAVMTVLPVRPPVSPAQVLLFLEQVHEKLTIVGLKEEEYTHTIRRTAESGALGGRI